MSEINVSNHNNFIDNRIGSDDELDQDYINTQKNILNNKKVKIYEDNYSTDSSDNTDEDNFNTFIDEEDRLKRKKIKQKKKKSSKKEKEYDLFEDYRYKRGLAGNDYITRYVTDYVIVNSSARRKEPVVKYSKTMELIDNPLRIERDILTVDVGSEHGLEIGDKVSLTGIKYLKKIIKTYTTYISNDSQGVSHTVKNYAVDVVKSLDDATPTFMRFDIGINMNADKVNLLSSTGFNTSAAFFLDDFTNNLKDKEFDLSYSDLYVDIDGFKTSDGTTVIGNIPLNLFNARHRIYFAPREKSSTDPVPIGDKILGISESILDHPGFTKPKSFYIKLPKAFEGDLTNIGAFNVNITFGYYGGIPVSSLNAEFPVGPDNINGFHKVHKVYDKKIEIKLDRNGYYSEKFGGNDIHLSKIHSIDTGHSYSNDYIVDLAKTFHNVVQTRLISSEFPNYEKVFKDNKSIGNANNKLYWQNLDDGDVTYSISVPSGSYSANNLKTTLEKLFYDTLKVQQSINSNSVFTRNNFVKVDINTNTDLVSFSSFKESIIDKPITKISPNIPEASGLNTSTDSENTYIVTLNHKLHGLKAGDTILIADMLTTLGIPSSKLNGEHKIESIITESSYTISISDVNLDQIRTNTSGGNGVKIYIPNIFRMRFDYSDTMGKQLGFRKPGNKSSVTPYTTFITNDNNYDGEINLDESGNTIVIKKNSLQLSGVNYILMVCKELNGIINLGEPKRAFAKINLSGLPGTILYNTYVPTINYYHEPIRKLSELTLQFYTPDGEFFDFDGLDHSFTLEITTIDEIPENTGISSSLGKLRKN